jgi:AcrR family transcriptional regulator
LASRDTREILIKTAIQLFARKGYWNTSIRDIGKKAGVSNSIVYHYFKDKEHLLFEILQTSSNELLQTLVEIEKNVCNPLKCLNEMLLAHTVLFSIKRKNETRIMASDRYWLKGKRRKIINQRQRDIYKLYKKKMLELNEMGLIYDIDLTVLNFSMFGIINSFYDWYRDRGRLTQEEVGQDIVKIVLNAILKKNIKKTLN